MPPLKQKLINYFGILVLLVLSVLSGYAAISSVGLALRHFSATPPEVIIFNRGFVMSLGAFITLSAFLIASIAHELGALIKHPKLAKGIMVSAVSGIALLFTLGFISQYTYDNYFVKSRDYTVCKDASSQWLFLKTTVYTKKNQPLAQTKCFNCLNSFSP
ncbi:hypothetical protein [Kangiella geojedonensis]|uniref:Uncharacterized protein n=1 Tax=Kangiella geojedonensis TaxID=914150 RepID=A0A0F6RCK6_9GAMM|nr:hypothetical protein [Kangiella geojedonensis]AKE52493.1 hypothetical protein TQ33_1547 [Kangiella geojedonensis]